MPEITYDLAQIVIGDIPQDIVCESFSVSFELDTEEKTTINSRSPYRVKLGSETIEWSCDAVDVDFRDQLMDLYERTKNGYELFDVVTFDYNEATGEAVESASLYDCYIKSIEVENSNGEISIEGGALRRKENNTA